MKCEICKQSITQLFLGKISGTYIKKDSKQIPICSACQSKFNSKKEIIDALVA